MTYLRNKLAVISGFVSALAVAVATTSHTYAAQVYDFSSSTEEAQALQTELAAQSITIVLGAIGAFIGIALILMGAQYVWGRFKKFTGMGKKL